MRERSSVKSQIICTTNNVLWSSVDVWFTMKTPSWHVCTCICLCLRMLCGEMVLARERRTKNIYEIATGHGLDIFWPYNMRTMRVHFAMVAGMQHVLGSRLLARAF